MLFNEFMYFFGMQKSIMNWPREQSAKECLKALNESGTAGAFLNQISSNFVHEIIIEHRIINTFQIDCSMYMKGPVDWLAKDHTLAVYLICIFSIC